MFLTPDLLRSATRGAFIEEMRGGSTLRIRASETLLLTFGISQFVATPVQVNLDSCGD